MLINLHSHPHLWSWALCSNQRNEVTNTNSWNGFPLPGRGLGGSGRGLDNRERSAAAAPLRTEEPVENIWAFGRDVSWSGRRPWNRTRTPWKVYVSLKTPPTPRRSSRRKLLGRGWSSQMVNAGHQFITNLTHICWEDVLGIFGFTSKELFHHPWRIKV